MVKQNEFDLDAVLPRAFGVGREPQRRVAEQVLVGRENATGRQGSPSRPTKAASVAPTIDRSLVIPDMPPEPLVLRAGFNCVVVVYIGGMPFRVTVDSGAARDVIRKSFAQQLRKDKRTREHTWGPRRMSRPVSFVRG